MKFGDYLTAIGVGIQVIADIEIDSAKLAAGESVPVNLQVGSDNGKPLHLTGTLHT